MGYPMPHQEPGARTITHSQYTNNLARHCTEGHCIAGALPSLTAGLHGPSLHSLRGSGLHGPSPHSLQGCMGPPLTHCGAAWALPSLTAGLHGPSPHSLQGCMGPPLALCVAAWALPLLTAWLHEPSPSFTAGLHGLSPRSLRGCMTKVPRR